ncbi:MAG: RNA polymerase sigma factor [Nanoarchaeota archaeon]
MNGTESNLITQIAEWFANEDNLDGLQRQAERIVPGYGEDVVHQTYAKAYDYLVRHPDFVLRKSINRWVYALARNAALDILKHDKSVRPYQDYIASLFYGEDPTPFLDTTLGETEEVTLARIVNEEVSRLPQINREVIILHYYERKGYPDIATLLGIGISAAKQRAFKGRGILSEAILSRVQNIPYCLESAA